MLFRLFKKRLAELRPGEKAPDFQLPSSDGSMIRLSDFFGKKTVVLYFYPKDNTYFCVHESSSFRDHYEIFRKAGAEVVGISSDTPRSHLGFSAKYRLPFILLSDGNNYVRQLYRVPPTLGLIPGRTTYVIDRGGIVRHVFTSQFRYDSHVKKALEVVEKLRHQPPVLETVR